MKMIFKCLTGSRAYGTNIETSDWDYKGVYIQTISEVLTSKYKDQYLIGKDEQYFEVKRFVELLKSANPTVLEMLYSHSMTTSSEWNILVQNASNFLTKKCIQSFGGYAVQQIKKAKGLNKKMNWEKEKTVRKNPIDFCTVVSGTSGQSKSLIAYLKECGINQEFVGISSLDKMPN